MKKLVLLVAIFSTLAAAAQNDFLGTPQTNIKKISVSIVPHYVLFNGLRVDFEYQNGKKANVFAPQFYFLSREMHPVTYRSTDLYKLYGAGLQYNRKFIRKTDYNNTGYLAVGLAYNFFYANFRQYLPVVTELYDNTVYDYRLQDITGQIHRLELNATLGLQSNLPIGIMVEGYLGIGYRYSMPFYSENIENPFDRAFDFAYSGPIFIVGAKFGFSKFLTVSQAQTF